MEHRSLIAPGWLARRTTSAQQQTLVKLGLARHAFCARDAKTYVKVG